MWNHSLADGTENFISGSGQKLSALGDYEDLETTAWAAVHDATRWQQPCSPPPFFVL